MYALPAPLNIRKCCLFHVIVVVHVVLSFFPILFVSLFKLFHISFTRKYWLLCQIVFPLMVLTFIIHPIIKDFFFPCFLFFSVTLLAEIKIKFIFIFASQQKKLMVIYFLILMAIISTIIVLKDLI